MRTVCIIQARMGSTRLPGKVLMPLAGRPILWHVVERARREAALDAVLVATTTNTEDDLLAAYCTQNGIPFFRGAAEDVLARYAEAATSTEADIIVRVTADCPLIHPGTIDECVRAFTKSGCDYLRNLPPGEHGFPRGFGLEVFSRRALDVANKDATLPADREHVTPYLWRNDNKEFTIGPEIDVPPAALRKYRLTVDYPEDYELMRRLYDALYTPERLITLPAANEFLDKHPEIAALNAHCKQR